MLSQKAFPLQGAGMGTGLGRKWGLGKRDPQIREDPGHDPSAQDPAAGFPSESLHTTTRNRCRTDPAAGVEGAELCAVGHITRLSMATGSCGNGGVNVGQLLGSFKGSKVYAHLIKLASHFQQAPAPHFSETHL